MARRSKGKRSAAQRQERRAKYAPARRELSKLKTKGLISPRANLRKDKPSSGLLKKLEVLRPVLTGQAEAVKLPPKQRRDFKDAGFTTTQGFTVFPKGKGERVKVSKEGLPELIPAPRPEGGTYGAPFMRRIYLPANVRNAHDFERFLINNPNGYDGVGGPGSLIAFTYFGNRSREVRPWEKLYDYLLTYAQIFDDDTRFEALLFYEMNYQGAKQWDLARMREANERDKKKGHFQPNAPLDEAGKAARRKREAARQRARRAKEKDRFAYEF